MSKNLLSEFDAKGFALVRNPFSSAQIDKITNSLEDYRNNGKSALLAGFRNLMKECAAVSDFAHSDEIKTIASALLGESAKPVRSIFFDKTPASNWYVTWHQDLSIAVEKRIDTEGFGPWSTKDGVIHVQPTREILEQIVSLRIHLDPCPAENGAIKFIAGSHKNGIIPSQEVPAVAENSAFTILPADRGDIIIMRPLILHSSSKAAQPEHRRVLHLEFSAAILPNGLAWTEA